MTREWRRRLLTAIAATMALLLVMIASRPGMLRDAPPSRREGVSMARWLERHPADVEAATAIASSVLDSDLPQRRAIWRAAYRHAAHLAPRSPNPAAGFVRGGLFHWHELAPNERREVLAAARPLLKDFGHFDRLHRDFWRLTRDFTYLRSTAPDDLRAIELLADLSVSNGLFSDYRELRQRASRKRLAVFEQRRADASLKELLALLPRKLSQRDDRLVKALLEELDRRSVDIAEIKQGIEEVARYSVDHDLQPLGGLASLVEASGVLREVTRARLALALDNPKAATRIEITTAASDQPDWRRYYLDRALFEARKGDSAMADTYLARAALRGFDAEVLATGLQIGQILGDAGLVATYQKQLDRQPADPSWRGTCGPDELCNVASSRFFIASDKPLHLEMEKVRSDETPPYVEIYVDDELLGEADIEGRRTFDIDAPPGIHAVEVRLVNRLTPNGVQRRVRLK